MRRPLRIGSAACCLLGAAVTVWAALQPSHETSPASRAQAQEQSRSEFLVTSQSQTEIRRMAQRMVTR